MDVKTNKKWIWVIVLSFVGVASRLIPHPPNFSAFTAVSLFSGIVFTGPLALIIPIASTFFGDLFLGFHDLIWVVYLSLLPMVWLGKSLPLSSSQEPGLRKDILTFGWAGLASAIFFFLTTNLAVWWSGDLYPHTLEGLETCFIAALPFFHNSVLGTWAYLGGLEVIRRLLTATERHRQPSPISEPNAMK